jgi:hypothetical protein
MPVLAVVLVDEKRLTTPGLEEESVLCFKKSVPREGVFKSRDISDNVGIG